MWSIHNSRTVTIFQDFSVCVYKENKLLKHLNDFSHITNFFHENRMKHEFSIERNNDIILDLMNAGICNIQVLVKNNKGTLYAQKLSKMS